MHAMTKKNILETYRNSLIQKRYSKNTQKIYNNYFSKFVLSFNDFDISSISTEQINTFILELIQTKHISISQ